MESPRLEGTGMAIKSFRVYYGPEENDATETLRPEHRRSVTVPLAEVLPQLLDAVRCNRTWLEDFADDEITISTDLYDVLLAYDRFRRPSA
jgi:hypothetical protein